MESQSLRNLMRMRKGSLAGRGMSGAFPAVIFLGVVVLTSWLTAPSASAKNIQQLPHEPNNPKIHQVYFNTTDKHEYIYNGEEWVPHDASIDTYVLKKYHKPKVHKNSDGSGNTKDSSDTQGVSQ